SANAEDVPGNEVINATNGGAVTIFYGSASGLRTDNAKMLTIASVGFPEFDDAFFGDALAAGDFNGDGRDDLAIGADGADMVFVARGSASGLVLQGEAEGRNNSFFGFALAVGDI